MVNTIVLENGLRIVIEEIPFVRSVALGVWIKSGSRNESKEINGISHFIEHMLFKGTTNRSARETADELDAIGGQMNAYTAKEFTCYYTRTLDSHFEKALDILSDMILNPLFDKTDIDKERNVILEEINMYEDSPEELVHDLLENTVFHKTALGFSILGTPESVAKIDRDSILDYYKRRYRPENIVIAVAGNIKSDNASSKISEYFGSLSADIPTDHEFLTAEYLPGSIKREKDIEQAHICIGFPGIPSGTDDSYALSIINTIFGGGMSSRLFQSLREEHALVYSIYSYHASYRDIGFFTIYAALNETSVKEAIKRIFDEIEKLTIQKITASQLQRTKEQIKSNYFMSLENSSSRMSGIGKSKLLLDKILSPDEIIAKIDNVTLDNISKLVSKIFDFDHISHAVVSATTDSIDIESLIFRSTDCLLM